LDLSDYYGRTADLLQKGGAFRQSGILDSVTSIGPHIDRHSIKATGRNAALYVHRFEQRDMHG